MNNALDLRKPLEDLNSKKTRTECIIHYRIVHYSLKNKHESSAIINFSLKHYSLPSYQLFIKS